MRTCIILRENDVDTLNVHLGSSTSLNLGGNLTESSLRKLIQLFFIQEDNPNETLDSLMTDIENEETEGIVKKFNAFIASYFSEGLEVTVPAELEGLAKAVRNGGIRLEDITSAHLEGYPLESIGIRPYEINNGVQIEEKYIVSSDYKVSEGKYERQDALSETKAIIAGLKEHSESNIAFDEDDHTYTITEENNGVKTSTVAEVTASGVYEYVNGTQPQKVLTKEEEEEKKYRLDLSSALGNEVDALVRSYFGEKAVESTKYLEDEHKDKILAALDRLKAGMDKKFGKNNYTVVADEIRIGARLQLQKFGTQSTKDILVAGTMDLLVYDNLGNLYIYDIKTFRGGEKGYDYNPNKLDSTDFGPSRKTKWNAQLDAYRKILYAMDKRLEGKVMSLEVVPFQLNYNNKKETLDSGGDIKLEVKPGISNEGDIMLLQQFTPPKLSRGEPQEVKDLMDKVIYKQYKQDSVDAVVQEILESKSISTEELIFLGKDTAFSLSYIIDVLRSSDEESLNEILDYYFNGQYKEVKFNQMSRKAIIEKVTLRNLYEAVRLMYKDHLVMYGDSMSPSSRSNLEWLIDGDNFRLLIYSSYKKLQDLEGISVSLDLGIGEGASEAATEAENAIGTISEEKGKAESWQIGYKHISVKSTLSQDIRRIIESTKIPSTEDPTVDAEDPYGYKIAITMDADLVVGSLTNWLSTADSIEEMESILQDKVQYFSWVSPILDMIKQEPLRSQFFSNFRKDRLNYSIIKYSKDSKGRAVAKTIIINKRNTFNTVIRKFKYRVSNYGMGDIVKLNNDTSKYTVDKGALEELKTTASTFLGRFNANDIDIDTLSKDFHTVLTNLDITVDIAAVQSMFIRGSRSAYKEFTYAVQAINSLNSLLHVISNASEGTLSPLDRNANSGILGYVETIVKAVSADSEERYENSVHQDGKTYQTHVTPNYLNKLIRKMKKNTEAFLKENFEKYGWFYNGIHYNRWLDKIKGNIAEAQQLDHKTVISVDGVEYKNMSPLSYMKLLVNEYFSEKGTAWFRVPILSNKPSCEFIRFKSEVMYEIPECLEKTFFQEFNRIITVVKRAEQNIQSTGKFIKNFDIKKLPEIKDAYTVDDVKKILTLSRGSSFVFLAEIQKMLLSPSDTSDTPKGKTTKEAREKILNALTDALNGNTINVEDLGSTVKTYIEEVMLPSLVESEIAKMESLGLLAVEPKTDSKGNIAYKSVHLDNLVESKADKDNLIENMKSVLEHFIIQDKLASINIIQLLGTDLAYYSTSEDFQKRIAQVHSPGTRFNTTATIPNSEDRISDGKSRTLILSDSIVESELIPNISKALEDSFSKKYGGNPSETDKEAFNVFRDRILDSFKKINVADGQAYSCPTSYRKKMVMSGKWTQEMEEAYLRLRESNYTFDDVALLLNPTKPFVYTHITQRNKDAEGDTMGIFDNLKVNMQHKNSEYMLFIGFALAQGANSHGVLAGISEFMEGSHYKTDPTSEKGYINEGIDTIQFASAVKTGLTGVIDISEDRLKEMTFEIHQKTKKDYITYKDAVQAILNKHVYQGWEHGINTQNVVLQYNPDYVHTFSYEDYSVQQEVPSHYTNHDQLIGSQSRVLGVTGFEDDVQFTVNGVNMSAKELATSAFKLHAANIKESLKDLRKSLGYGDEVTNPRDVNKKLSALLKEYILRDSKYSIDMLNAVSLDENDNFNIPLSDPILSIRIQQLLNSIITNRINKQYVRGGSLVQVSCFGLTESLNIRFKDKNGNLLLTKAQFEQATERGDQEVSKYASFENYIAENQHSIAYFEAYAPIPSKKLKELLRKKDEYGNYTGEIMTPDEAVKAKIITEDYLRAIGYRVPTESKYSMAPIKIVGWMPEFAGEGVMLPKEIVTLSGSDFDIDKLYIVLKETKETKKGIKVIKSIRSNALLDDTVINEAERKRRNNSIFDLHWAVLTSEAALSDIFNIGNFDPQKRASRKIALLKSGTIKSWGELSEMSIEDLDAELSKVVNTDITLSTTQVHFHKKNMVADKLIGIFANHNTSSAFVNYTGVSYEGYDFTIGKHRVKPGDRLDSINSRDLKVKTAKNIAGYLAAAVDGAKDDVLEDLNLNTATANVAMVLIRMGIDVDTVALFLAQPVIVEAVETYFKSNEGKGYATMGSIIKDMLDGADMASRRSQLDSKISLSTETLVQGIRGVYDEDTKYKILNLFDYLYNVGNQLNTLTFLTKFNSTSNALGPTIADTMVMKSKIQEWSSLKDPVFVFTNNNKDRLSILKDNPLLDAFYTSTLGEDGAESLLLKGRFPHYTSAIESILYDYAKRTKSKLNADTIELIVSDFITYYATRGLIASSTEERMNFMHNSPIGNQEGFFTRLGKAKGALPNNEFLKHLEIEDVVVDGITYKTVNFRSSEFSQSQLEIISGAWESLLLTDYKLLALDLLQMSILRTGFSYSPNGWGHLATTRLKRAYHTVVDNNTFSYVNELASSTIENSVVDDGNFLDQFQRNHAHNRKIVPRFKGSYIVRGNNIHISRKNNNNATLSPITIDENTTAKFIYIENIGLFTFVKSTGDTIIYTKTSRLGVRNVYKEYAYGNKSLASVFDAYDSQNITPTVEEDLEVESQEEDVELEGDSIGYTSEGELDATIANVTQESNMLRGVGFSQDVNSSNNSLPSVDTSALEGKVDVDAMNNQAIEAQKGIC